MSKISLETKVFTSIHEIKPEEWNSINSIDDIFHTHLFLANLEDSKVENSENHYLMIYSNGELVATTVISSFIVNLDIFIQANKLVKAVRKVWKNWLKIKMLICGVPASLGQKNIVIKHQSLSSDIILLVSEWMKAHAKKKRIKYLVFKEFRSKETTSYDILEKHRYFRALSLPYTYLDIKWNSFDAYLKNIRHGYKRQISMSLKKIGLSTGFAPIDPSNKFPKLEIVDSSICTPEIFYPSYIEVMTRATSKLETFNEEFFRNYFNSHKDQLIFLVLKDENKIYGSAILVPHGHEITFALVGKIPEKDDYDTYFNLITFIVKYSIEKGYKKVNMGQTSYYPKMKMGAVVDDEFIYFYSRKIIMHGLLKLLKNVVFPATKIQEMKIFKSQE